ncbi:MAG: nucleotidyltransferase domain-containing protein [Candidatus Aminicenantes bacterium]|nr:MAG: nucleotidyltransferase domain-containing protein [Candidatus Aminicenantes bacterium]
MTLRNNEKIALKTLKERLSSHYPILDFRIFGSKVRKEDTPQSDIDVMIKIAELSPGIESDIYDIVFDVNLENDCFISVIIFSNEEIENGPMSESPIYKTIMREGVII